MGGRDSAHEQLGRQFGIAWETPRHGWSVACFCESKNREEVPPRAVFLRSEARSNPPAGFCQARRAVPLFTAPPAWLDISRPSGSRECAATILYATQLAVR